MLDLHTDAGTRALRALVETADVFIHSMRAKAIAKLGFGYEDVAALNPATIYINRDGYGRRGPYRDRPAYDDTIQAECGLPAVQQQLTGEADYVGTIMADKVAGLTALYATTMALFHRERTGRVRKSRPPCSKPWPRLCSSSTPTAPVRAAPGAGGVSADRGAELASRPHQRRLHRRADLQRQALDAFVNAVRPPWANEGYATLAQRAREKDTVDGLLAETMKQRSTQEGLDLLHALEIPAAPLNTPSALFDDRHLNAVGMFETVDTPHGPVRFPGVPTWFSQTPGRVAGRRQNSTRTPRRSSTSLAWRSTRNPCSVGIGGAWRRRTRTR